MFDFAPLIKELKQYSYSRYLWLMLAPTTARPQLLALLALDVELAQIPGKVSEEMLGQIRYTWWQESIEQLEQGEVRKHPLVELWASLGSQPGTAQFAHASQLIDLHREHFEQHMDLDAKMDVGHALSISRDYVVEACGNIIESTTPEKLAIWQRKVAIIRRYEERAACRPGNVMLMLRLLLCFR